MHYGWPVRYFINALSREMPLFLGVTKLQYGKQKRRRSNSHIHNYPLIIITRSSPKIQELHTLIRFRHLEGAPDHFPALRVF